MRNLYRRTNILIPDNLELNTVEQDIRDNWKPDYNLFTYSQMCDRHSISKRACRRKLRRFLNLGIIRLRC